jgi:chromate transporter
MTLASLLGYFLRLGATGFGGPAALADRMRRDLVDTRGWITAAEYEMGLGIAAACPGPLAFQLAVYCGYVRFGVAGALGVAVAFALAPFLLVVAIAAVYADYSASPLLLGIFYGVGPVVVALVVRACWRLGQKTLGRDRLAWTLAVTVFVASVATGREPTGLILAAGAIGAFALARGTRAVRRPVAPGPPAGAAALAMITSASAASAGPATVFSFFFKTGCLVFGSGLVIAPFLKSYVVTEFHWLTDQQFRDAIAVGLVSPGPVVIVATFVGYIVDGLRGAVAATFGMFAPAVIFTIAAAPLFQRYGADRRVQGFIRGVTTAVVGVLAATAPQIASSAVIDVPTGVILLAGLGLLAVPRLPEPLVVGAGAVAGIAIRVLA